MTLPASKNAFPFADSIGARVREERTRRQLSDNRLAKMAGVSRRHLVELQKGANVTLSIAEKVMVALDLQELSFAPERRLTVPAAGKDTAPVRQQLDRAAQQIDVGIALILNAASAFRKTTPAAAATPRPDVNTDLAAKAASLIDDFGAYVRSLDSEDQVDALQRLASSLLIPPATGRKRKAKTA
jgi:transcriptional regulator with XRE-family HTH domain